MQRFAVIWWLVFLIAGDLSGAAEPSAKELMEWVLVESEALLPVTDASGCSMQELGSHPKIRNYLAFLLSTLAQAGKKDTQSVRALCKRVTNKARWQCELGFRVVDSGSESPWEYGIRFEVRVKERTVDLKTIACFGAG